MTSSLVYSKFLVILVVFLSCRNVFAEEPSSPTTETETPPALPSDSVKEYSELICGGNNYCQSALFATRQFLNVLGRELLKIKIPNFLNANDNEDEEPIIIETPPTFPPQGPQGIKVDEKSPVVTENVPETVSEPEPVPVIFPVTNQEPTTTETETKAEPLEIENELDTGKSVLETEPVTSPIPVPVQGSIEQIQPIVADHPAETVSKPPQVPTQTETIQNGQEKHIDQNVYDPLSTLTVTKTQDETIINVRITRDAYYDTIEDVLYQDHGEPLTKLTEDLENGGEGYEEDYITNFNNVNLEYQGHENNNTATPKLQQAENENQNHPQQSYDRQTNRDTFSPEIITNINYRENPENAESQINTAQNDLGREFEKFNQYSESPASLSKDKKFDPTSESENLDWNSAEDYIDEKEAQTYHGKAQAQDEDRLETRAQTEGQFATYAQTQSEDQFSTPAQTQAEDQLSTHAQTQQESIQSQHLPPVENNVPTHTIGQNPTTAPVPPLVQPEPQVAYEKEDDYYDPETETTQEQKQTGTHAQEEFEDDYDDDDEEDLPEVPRIPSHESYTNIPRERDPRVEL